MVRKNERSGELDSFLKLTQIIEADEGIDAIVQQWDGSESNDPDDLTHLLWEYILEHLVGQKETRSLYMRIAKSDDFSMSADELYANETLIIASNILERRLGDLIVSGRNCARLLNHVSNFDSPAAYGSLITDYAAYLESAEYEALYTKAKSIFIEGLADEWRSFARAFEINTTTNISPPVAVLLQDLTSGGGRTADGLVVRANRDVWDELIRRFSKNWELAYQVPAARWEEIIASAFDAAGYDKVILTPRSCDRGRDVIAEKHGFGAIKIAISVKAYNRDRLVPYDDIRALAGVVAMDTTVSKGMITTLSDFPPLVLKDPLIAPLVPFRLELINGEKLRQWLKSLSK